MLETVVGKFFDSALVSLISRDVSKSVSLLQQCSFRVPKSKDVKNGVPIFPQSVVEFAVFKTMVGGGVPTQGEPVPSLVSPAPSAPEAPLTTGASYPLCSASALGQQNHRKSPVNASQNPVSPSPFSSSSCFYVIVWQN